MPHEVSRLSIFDSSKRELLATATDTLRPGSASDCRLIELDGADRLLAYYFGKAQREVLVAGGAGEGITATLETRWAQGHREWKIRW